MPQAASIGAAQSESISDQLAAVDKAAEAAATREASQKDKSQDDPSRQGKAEADLYSIRNFSL